MSDSREIDSGERPIPSGSELLKHVPDELQELVGRFRKAGFTALLVGGSVRNMLLHGAPQDYDLATDATPRQVRRLFRRTIPTGIQHGTVTVLYRGLSAEVTTFRTEASYSDGRRPDAVEYTSDVEADLSRRDFTINAVALDLRTGELTDPFGGISDLRRGVIRTVGKPSERFSEDGLRLLRAVRFAAQLEFTIETGTLAAIREERRMIASVAAERIREELEKLLGARRPGIGLRPMERTELLDEIVPELARCRGAEGGGSGHDLLSHQTCVCECLPRDDLGLRLAGLLHDIGKPDTLAYSPEGEPTFHGHERIGAERARDILGRLRFPNAVIDRVEHLIRQHMFDYEPTFTDAAVRRFLARVGRDHVESLLRLRQADVAAKSPEDAEWAAEHGPDESPEQRTSLLRAHIERVVREDCALTVGDLDTNGHQLAELGIPRGPEMGEILQALLEIVIEDPRQNERARLHQLARELYTQRFAKKQGEREG